MIKEKSVFSKLLVSFFAIAFSINVFAQTDYSDPYQLIESVADTTFARIKANKSEIDKNPELLRTIMKEELLPHIDYQFAAFKVLGKNFRTVPQEKLPEYVQTFRSYLITTYAIALSYYDDQEVFFEPSSDFKDKKAVTVRAVIKDKARPDIKIAFQVRKNPKTNEWKAYDMVAEGISLIDSKRSEFESILRQDGIDKVIVIMNDRISKPLELDIQEDESNK